MQLGNLISSARRNDDQPKPKREPRLKIDAAPVTGVVSHDKARPSDLGYRLHLRAQAIGEEALEQRLSLKDAGVPSFLIE